MSTLVIKNLPEDIHEKLRVQAARNRRSVTKEAVTLIEAGVSSRAPKIKLSAPLKLKGGPISMEEIEAAIAEGQE